MTHEEFDSEKRYCVSISLAKVFWSKGLLTKEEYTGIDAFLRDKYHSILSAYLSEMPLANISI